MTDFLTLNGLAVEIADGRFTGDPDDLLDEGRAEDGTFFRTEISRKRRYQFTTTILTPSEAEALKGWVDGRGDLFSFNSTKYGSKAYGPSAGGTHSISSSEKKFGASSLLVGSGSTISYAFGSEYSSAYSYAAWKRTASNVFTHYGITSAGTQYKAGSTHTATGSDGVTLWSSMSTGTLTLDGQDIGGVNSASAYYDHLVVVPYVMTAAMFAALAADSSGIPGLPRLTAVVGSTAGTTVTMTAHGKVTGEEFMQAVIDGTFYADARVLSGVLHEA